MGRLRIGLAGLTFRSFSPILRFCCSRGIDGVEMIIAVATSIVGVVSLAGACERYLLIKETILEQAILFLPRCL
jgi:hypothetical protein